MRIRKLQIPGKLASNPARDILFITDLLYEGSAKLSHDDARTYGDAFRGIEIEFSSLTVMPPCRPVSRSVAEKAKELNPIMKEDRPRFVERVNSLNPKLIVVAGSNASRQVFGRAVKITEMRGLPTTHKDYPNAVILPIYSGAHVRRVPEYAQTFDADFRMIDRLVRSRYDIAEATQAKNVKYTWVTDLQFIIDAKPKLMALDTEYTGGDWYTGKQRLLTIQLCYEEGVAYAIPIDYPQMPISNAVRARLLSQLRILLEDPEIGYIGHNIKGDVHVLREALGFTIANLAHDTLVMVHDVNENLIRKALSESVRAYVPAMSGYSDVYDHDPDHQGKSRMDLFPADKMLMYAAGDADASLRLFNVLSRILRKDEAAWNCYLNVRMKAYRVFIDIERVGFYVNTVKLDEFQLMLTEHQRGEQQALLAEIPESILSKYRNTGVGIKISRAEILRDYLFTHPHGLRLKPLVFTKGNDALPSVSGKQHLPYFTHVPFVVRLMDYLKNDKLLTTYVNGYYKYIFDERVRPSYNLHTAATGRTASSKPNGQNNPKRGRFAKKFNEIFVAPKGWTIIDADFSQVELRVVADEANETRMIRIYKDGGDIHEATAAGVMDMTVEEFRKLPKDVRKLKRNQAKPVNFGFLYGMGWKKFKVFAKTDYGIDFTDEEAADLRDKFFRTYPGLAAWHTEAKKKIARDGYIRSKSGKLRRLPGVHSKDETVVHSALRQGINAPIQEFGNTLGLVALHYLSEMMPKDTFHLCGYIHDDIIAYVKDEHLVEAADKFKHIMEHLPISALFKTRLKVPIVAEVAFGKNKANMHEYADYYNEIKKSGATSTQQVLRLINKLHFSQSVAALREKPKEVTTRVRKLQIPSKRK